MKYIVWHNFGALELWPSLPKTTEASLYGIMKGALNAHRVFQTDGVELRPVSEKPETVPAYTWWRRILAEFYNPKFKIPVSYRENGRIELEELKRIILRGVKQDDDILTQFLEYKDIKLLLEKTKTFPDLIDAVRAMSGECETDAKLRKKLEHMGISFDEE